MDLYECQVCLPFLSDSAGPLNQGASDKVVFMSEHNIHTDPCALSGCVCVLTMPVCNKTSSDM